MSKRIPLELLPVAIALPDPKEGRGEEGRYPHLDRDDEREDPGRYEEVGRARREYDREDRKPAGDGAKEDEREDESPPITDILPGKRRIHIPGESGKRLLVLQDPVLVTRAPSGGLGERLHLEYDVIGYVSGSARSFLKNPAV